jgi:hypothetical protein
MRNVIPKILIIMIITMMFSLVMLMGCIDVSGFLEQEAEHIFQDNNNTTISEPGVASDSEAGNTSQPLSSSKTTENTPANLSNNTAAELPVCTPTNDDDPYYCITEQAIAKKDLSLCEQIPAYAEQSVRRCIKVLAQTYGKSTQWCADNLNIPENIDYCKKMIMTGQKF